MTYQPYSQRHYLAGSYIRGNDTLPGYVAEPVWLHHSPLGVVADNHDSLMFFFNRHLKAGPSPRPGHDQLRHGLVISYQDVRGARSIHGGGCGLHRMTLLAAHAVVMQKRIGVYLRAKM
jgi:hypothetical protein